MISYFMKDLQLNKLYSWNCALKMQLINWNRVQIKLKNYVQMSIRTFPLIIPGSIKAIGMIIKY